MSYSRTIILGDLGKDPELRHTKKQLAVCTMSVATDNVRKKGYGILEMETEWHRVVVFGKQAENSAKYLKKGQQVHIEGRNHTRKYEDKEGITRSTTEIIAERVEFLRGSKKDAPAAESEEGIPSIADTADPLGMEFLEEPA